MPQRQRLTERGFGARYALLGTSVAFCLAIVAPARAEDDVDPFSLSPEQLFDATVMSVSKKDETVATSPAAVFVLTNEDIKRSGATSIPEALRLVPGVQVARTGNAGWAISVRGFNNGLANKLLVLIDGREVYDALFSGVYWDIQDTPLADVERIEVIRGPGASLWGANAVNGVINVITKSAASTQGTLLSVTAGNEERDIVTGRFGAKTDNVSWRLYAKYFDRDAQETSQGTGAHDDWHALRGGFRADWDEDSSGNRFTLQGDVYSSDTAGIRSVPELTPPYAVTIQDDISARGGNVLARWTRDLDEGASLSVQAYVDLLSREQFSLDNDRSVFDIEAQYNLPSLGAHEIITGLHYRYSREELTASPIITFTNSTRDDQLISGFIQDKITLEPKRWFLTLGSKFEHNDYSGFEMQPSARLQWQGDGQMAWGAVSRAVRTPSMLEHNLNAVTGVIPPGVFPVPVSVELTPSPGFDSEELIAYELGYRRELTQGLQMDLAAFFNDYDKLATYTLAPSFVDSPPLHLVLPIVTTNDTKGETYGFELVLNWRAADNLNLSAAYSLLEIDLHGPPSDQAIASEAGEGQSPEQQFNLRALWDVTNKLAFDTTLYYVDALPSLGIDSYWRYDTRLGWHVADGVELELVGQDLFDDAHPEFGGTQIQRSIYARMTWRS
ncbi:MAG: TonB-dependent receptor plug domain-containing protein [Alphaproteobacteria bacterium]|nr:TonB-dependent receptor plug domain-containing protein [Alphaproteobacteria bacterium]